MLVCQCSIAGERCHCFVSQIVQCGGSVKDSMEPACHHDADLTFGRCAHTRLEDLSKVLDGCPTCGFPTPFPHRTYRSVSAPGRGRD